MYIQCHLINLQPSLIHLEITKTVTAMNKRPVFCNKYGESKQRTDSASFRTYKCEDNGRKKKNLPVREVPNYFSITCLNLDGKWLL